MISIVYCNKKMTSHRTHVAPPPCPLSGYAFRTMQSRGSPAFDARGDEGPLSLEGSFLKDSFDPAVGCCMPSFIYWQNLCAV